MKKYNFSIYDRPKIEPTNAGSRMKETFTCYFDSKDGVHKLKKTGEIDIQEQIDSVCPPDVSEIFSRAQLGDLTLMEVNKENAQYADVSFIHDLGDVYLLNQKGMAEAEKALKLFNDKKTIETKIENENETKEIIENES